MTPARDLTELDAHEQPSDTMRAMWKAISKSDQDELLQGPGIDDIRSPECLAQFRQTGTIPAARISAAYSNLVDSTPSSDSTSAPDLTTQINDAPIYHHPMLPGLLIIPNLLTPDIQKTLLDRMIHRDLSNPKHQTNLHLHHQIPYPPPPSSSLFHHPPDSPVRFDPKDPAIHKPLSIKQVLDRRLHWLTLGGQYDWTNRVYPEGEEPLSFPPDMAGFLRELFPQTVAQAAIVNFYSPGDTMMMHRDVSEKTDKGLISISMGCDGLFMITPNSLAKIEDVETRPDGEQGVAAGGKPYLLLRIRSGDAIYMTEESRYAWHGVPKVLKGTCPDYLADWPAEDGKYEEWRGWVKTKRINLNVRQMDE